MRTVFAIGTVLATALTNGAGAAGSVSEIVIDPKPVFYPAPEFPQQCAGTRLESNFVVVEYDLTIDGETENLTVVESSNECFDESALAAAAKFRYEPRIVDGLPAPARGVRNRFVYSTAAISESVEARFDPVRQLIFDGDGAAALELLDAFETEREQRLNRYEYATMLWMRGVAQMLEKNYPAARDDLRAALDSNDLYPETSEWIRSLLTKVEAKTGE